MAGASGTRARLTQWLTTGPPWRGPVMVWVTIFLFIGLTTGDLFGAASIRNYRLATQGRMTTGTVSALELSNHGGCRYAYLVSGARYSDSESRCGSGRSIGDRLTVTYWPSDPKISTTGNASTQLRDGLLPMFLAPTLLAGVFFVAMRGRRAPGASPF